LQKSFPEACDNASAEVALARIASSLVVSTTQIKPAAGKTLQESME